MRQVCCDVCRSVMSYDYAEREYSIRWDKTGFATVSLGRFGVDVCRKCLAKLLSKAEGR